MYVHKRYRGVEQLVARRAHNPEVGGSNPPSATKGKPLILKTSQVLSIGGDSFFRTEIPQFSPLFWLFNDVQLLFAS